jgi:hypothetical protein
MRLHVLIRIIIPSRRRMSIMICMRIIPILMRRLSILGLRRRIRVAGVPIVVLMIRRLRLDGRRLLMLVSVGWLLTAVVGVVGVRHVGDEIPMRVRVVGRCRVQIRQTNLRVRRKCACEPTTGVGSGEVHRDNWGSVPVSPVPISPSLWCLSSLSLTPYSARVRINIQTVRREKGHCERT